MTRLLPSRPVLSRSRRHLGAIPHGLPTALTFTLSVAALLLGSSLLAGAAIPATPPPGGVADGAWSAEEPTGDLGAIALGHVASTPGAEARAAAARAAGSAARVTTDGSDAVATAAWHRADPPAAGATHPPEDDESRGSGGHEGDHDNDDHDDTGRGGPTPTPTPEPEHDRPAPTPEPEHDRPAPTPEPEHDRPTPTPESEQHDPAPTPQPTPEPEHH